jgi:hypothetical protein
MGKWRGEREAEQREVTLEADTELPSEDRGRLHRETRTPPALAGGARHTRLGTLLQRPLNSPKRVV